MKKNILFLFIIPFLLLSQYSYAQSLHYANWAFGSGVKVSFLSGSPVASCGLPMFASEGCASISNPVTGDFIAYTNGSSVWNASTNTLIGTGLIGSSTSEDAAMIIPKPGGTIDQFYIFHNNTFTAYYSEVDMSLGAITNQNVLLGTNTTERMGSVPYSNCTDYWVVIMAGTNAQIAAYLVTSAGVSSTA